ncbi:MBG domain-containing protein [Cyclobacterium plantarum]|uniref:T9SS type B sorting domain-containing protein n=1 Tax=Cyclobacterium plantarum TaxID=2716263 RepID=A0ABX0H2W2_9BACT|nr:MBG domain-containing protein [Cyclobacterium plantarum]NHE56145.1 T9SS type B sorting domain-containing protein [Cyclobacterium plantarum]
MKLLLKNLLLLILLFFSCQQIRAQSTTVTFNEITNYIGTFGETYDNGGLSFSVTKEANATPNSGIKATETEGYQGTVALNDSNIQPGGIKQWSIQKTDGSLFQFISIFLQEGGVGASTTGTISAYRAGSLIGSPKPIAFNSATDGLKTFDNDPDFYEVDEIRINADDIYNFLDHVTTGPPFSPLDEDPPLVTGITLNGAPPTTSESVTFTVNFSKTALNVSLDDFSLITSGTTGSLAAISGSGNSYQVTVNAISGEGFLRLDLKSGTNITNEDNTSGVPAFSSGNTHSVSACFLENMESLPDASSNFSSNGLSFSLSTGLESESRLGFGAGNSNDFIKNNSMAGTFSISSSSLFTMNTVDLFLSDLSNGDNPTASGTLTITGKNNGNTVFTILKTSGFPVNTTQNGGFFTLDFSTAGDQNYRNTNVDEVEFTIADGFVELLIDNFNFCQEVPDTDTAAPAVQRILLDGNPGSTATSITYIVQFDENALNVSLDDFTLVRTGIAAGTLNQINGTGSTFQVEVTGISGEGSLQLQLNGGTDIADALNNSGPLEYLNGQIHLVGACFSESFEDETDGAVTFSGNGLNFSLTGNWAVKNRIGFGANASAKYLENSGTGPYGIQSTATPVTVNRIGLYLSSFPSGVSPTNDGTLTVTGKLNGNTLYTFQKTTGFPDDFGSTGGYFTLDFETAGASDFSDVLIDELILEPGADFTYLALDNFDFCTDNTAPAGYTVQIDQDAIGETNQDQVSFTFSGAELGSTYNYSFTSSGGGTVVTGSGTISGAEEMVNGIDLTGLSNGTVTLSVTLTDISGNEGAEATAQSTKFINTIPQVSPDVFNSPPYQENASSLLIAETIAISDADGDQLVRAVIQIRGTGVISGDNLSLGDPSPLSLQEVDANTLELTGTADAGTYTSILRTLSFSSDSEDPTLGGIENVRIISIIVEDENGGLSEPANGINNLQLAIEAVNDAPEVVLPSNDEVISNQPLTFNATNGNAISVSDADVGDNSLMVDLTVSNGTLDLADISGLTFVLGSGTDNSNMQFSGNLASINNALEGMVFTSTTDFVGEAILSIEIDDQGNTGSGGSLTANNTLTIQVIAPNAPPLASNVSFTGSLIEGGNLLGQYSYSDAENDTESGSSIQWWLADDAAGTNEEVIAGENGINLTIIPAFLGRFISFEITPGDGINTGNPVKSDYQGPVYTLPLVSTAIPAGIEANAASLGGEVSSEQFSPVTERGLVYNTSGNPDLSDSKILLGSGTGVFSSLVSSLNPNATYYVRAYASNAAGTSFGQEESFTTEKQELTIGGSFTAENKIYDGTNNALILGNELILTSPLPGDDVVLSNLVIEFSDPQRGNDKVVTIVSADLSGTAAGNYSLSLTGAPSALATISPKALSISASEGISKIYGQPEPPFNFTSSGFVAGEDATLLTGSLSREPGENVGSYAITEGDLSAGDNYAIDFTAADFVISPQTLSITANAGQAKVYGQADPVFSFASSGFVAGDDETLLTGSLNREPGENVGSYAITEGDLSAGDNYTIDFTAADFAISPQTLSITANADQTKVYGQADPVFSFASSGFVAGDDETLLTGSLSREPGEDVGSYAITVGNLSAGDNYTIDFTAADFAISPQTLIITANADQTKVYGQADPVFSFASSGFVAGDDETLLTGSLSREPGEDVGSYAITEGNLSAGDNYAIAFTAADFAISPQTLSIMANADQTKVYGQADPVFSFASSGFVAGDDASLLTGSLSREPGEDVGSYAITVGNLSAGDNYAIAFTAADFAISPQTLIITANAGQAKVYGQADPVFSFASSGFVAGDDETLLTGSLSREPGEDVGSYAITEGNLSAGDNYAIAFTAADFAISPQTLSIMANADQTKVYGQADPVFSFASSGFVAGDDASLLTGSLSREPGEDVGSYAITVGNLSAGDNYVIAFTAADFTISPQTLLISANTGQTKSYGQADPVFSFASSGFVAGDDASLLSGSLSREPGEDVGSYAITEGNLSAGDNYAIDFTAADFAISPQTLIITANAGQAKVYGQADPDFSFASSGFVAGDDASLLTGSLSRQPGEEVGSYAVTEGDLSAGDNYTIDFTAADFAISPQTLSITANADQTKVYGQADPVFSFASSGFVAGDDASLLTGSLSREPGEDVGSYAITTGNLSAGVNYTIAFTAADFAISPQTLIITVNAGQAKVYGQADPDFSFASSGFVAGDDETLLTGSLNREPGENVGSYAITEGDLSAGDNYQVLFSGAPFQILPRVKPHILILDETGNAMADPANLLDQTLAAGQMVYLDKVNFDCTDLGEQEIEVSVVDVNANTFTSNTILTVKDQTPPIPMLPTLPVLHSECQLESWETPTAEDNCGGIIIGTPDRNLPIRENTLVTWTFVDLGGNLTSQTQEVIIKDNTSPIIEGVPEDETVYLNGSYQLPDFTQVATAQDNCSLVRFIQSPAAGTRFDQAEKIQVQLLATDAEGNESSTGFEINLLDLNLLAIDDPDLISIPWNSPLESLALPEEIAVHLSNGQEVTIPVEWIIPVLDTRVAGLFQYKGSLELGNIQNPNQLEPSLSILVEDKAFPLGINISTEDFPANIEPGTAVGTLSTQDPQDNVHVYGLSGSAADNQYFGISGNELYWNSQDALPGKTTFTVEVSSTDRAGNIIYETFTLNRLRVALREINVPNTFTPNGDGFNDSWGIKGLRYFKGGKVAVYERSGKRVFYTENPDELWDGTFFGNALPTGTYFWVISTGESGEVRRGVLTIFRD